MFKKSMAALAVLGAFAGSTLAADVALYGVVDYGLIYQDYDLKDATELEGDSLKLDSGVNAASRIGLMGSEDLGNGYKVSFKLENGFDADDGALGKDNTLFNREARLTVEGPWGELSAGRMGALGSAAGTYDTVFAIGDAFDGGDGEIFAAATTDRYDNMLTYRSPKFAGMQVTAQYSLKLSNAKDNPESDFFPWGMGEEGHNSANRYAGLALTGEYGSLRAAASYETLIYSTLIPSEIELDDAQIFSLGANYDFGVAKVFAMGQYFENMPVDISYGRIEYKPFSDGYALHTGTQIPMASGTLTAGLYYLDAEESRDSDAEFKKIAGSVKYELMLSARTTLYSSIGYAEMKDSDGPRDEKMKYTQIYAGITHTF